MNYRYLFGGGVLCMLIAMAAIVTGAASSSPYVVGGIVLMSLGLAVKNQ